MSGPVQSSGRTRRFLRVLPDCRTSSKVFSFSLFRKSHAQSNWCSINQRRQTAISFIFLFFIIFTFTSVTVVNLCHPAVWMAHRCGRCWFIFYSIIISEFNHKGWGKATGGKELKVRSGRPDSFKSPVEVRSGRTSKSQGPGAPKNATNYSRHKEMQLHCHHNTPLKPHWLWNEFVGCAGLKLDGQSTCSPTCLNIALPCAHKKRIEVDTCYFPTFRPYATTSI